MGSIASALREFEMSFLIGNDSRKPTPRSQENTGKTSKRGVDSAVSALLTGMMLVRSQISNWKFSKQHDRSKMAGQVVINNFVFDDLLSAMRCMKPTDEPAAATPSVDGIAVSKAGMS